MELNNDETKMLEAYRAKRLEIAASDAADAAAASRPRKIAFENIKGGMSPEDSALASAEILAVLKGLGF